MVNPGSICLFYFYNAIVFPENVLFSYSVDIYLIYLLSLDIDVIGDFTKLEPSQASQNALKNVISCGQEAEVLSRSADITTDPEMKGNAFFEMIE